jgi:hypothetical protein
MKTIRKPKAPAWAVEGNEIWEKNLAALKARPGNLDLLPPLPDSPPPLQRVKLLAGKHVSLQVLGEDGRRVTLHSPRRALEEAQELAAAAPVGQSPYLVALGLGLGYHLVRLLPFLGEDQQLIMVEKEPEVLWAALATLDLSELWRHPRTMLVVSPEAAEVLDHLKGRLPRVNGNGLSFWGLPPSLRSHQSYYQEVVSRLKPSRGAPTRPVGLNKDTLRVMMINPDYFLLPEVCRAFRQLGHQVHLSMFNKRRARERTSCGSSWWRSAIFLRIWCSPSIIWGSTGRGCCWTPCTVCASLGVLVCGQPRHYPEFV